MKAISWIVAGFVVGFFAGTAPAALPPGATATESRALTGGRPAEAVLDALEVRAKNGVETWRFRFATFGLAKGGLPEYQLRFEDRLESTDGDGTPQTRRPARLILLVRRLRRLRPTRESFTTPAAKSDWIETVHLWPALDGDDRAIEFELREGGTHRLEAKGDTLELTFLPAAVLRPGSAAGH